MRLLFLALVLSVPLSGCYWDDRPDGLDPDRDDATVPAEGYGSDSRMLVSPTMQGGTSAASEALGNGTPEARETTPARQAAPELPPSVQ